MYASVLMLGAHEQDGLDDRLSLDVSAATCTRHVVPLIHSHHLNTLSICQHIGSPMKMILRNLFKISQIRSIIADTHR